LLQLLSNVNVYNYYFRSVTKAGTNQNLQSTPLPVVKADSVKKQRSCFAVSPEMLQATSFDVNNSDTCENNGAISDFSMSSDEVIEYMIEVGESGLLGEKVKLCFSLK
jgi:hypothetical protein